MAAQAFRLDHNGIALACRAWLPQEAHGCVQIMHGLGEHSGRYTALAEHLVAAGYAVYALDARGHGETAPTPTDLGHYADAGGWRTAIADMHALNREIAQRHPGLPCVLLGHSMGSMMAQTYAIDHSDSIDGLVLIGSTFDAGLAPRAGRTLASIIIAMRGPRHRSGLLDFVGVGAFRYSVKERRTDKDWLSRDPAVVDAYLADPLCGTPCTAALWRDAVEGLIYNARADNLARVRKDLPILMLVGGADPLSQGGRKLEKLADAYRRNGIADVALRIYPEARHEILNELNKEEVQDHVLAWLEKRVETQREA